MASHVMKLRRAPHAGAAPSASLHREQRRGCPESAVQLLGVFLSDQREASFHFFQLEGPVLCRPNEASDNMAVVVKTVKRDPILEEVNSPPILEPILVVGVVDFHWGYITRTPT